MKNEEYFPSKIFMHCPKCGGSHFELYNAKAKKCKDCDFVFYFNSAAAVAAIIRDEQGRVLLTKRAFEPNKDMLDLPGGFVDPLESAESALHREISEELSIEVVEEKYLGSFSNTYLYGGIVYFTMDMAFECKVSSFANIVVADDVSNYAFFDINDSVLERVGAESIRNILKKFCCK